MYGSRYLFLGRRGRYIDNTGPLFMVNKWQEHQLALKLETDRLSLRVLATGRSTDPLSPLILRTLFLTIAKSRKD